jgi:hypothetical protein
MNNLRQFARGFVVAAVASCTTASEYTVRTLIQERSAKDGTYVTVRGVLGLRHGLVNLFSHDREECIGLLTYVDEGARYSRLDGRTVVASGTLQSEGCGREGFCDEHLCGPAILRNVSVTPLGE